VEVVENFTVALSDPKFNGLTDLTKAKLGASNSATVTITDNDTASISFEADTIKKTMSVNLKVIFGDRYIKSRENRDSLIQVKHEETFINTVYFHLADTIHYPGSFSKKMDELGLTLYDGQFLRTLDTTYYAKVKLKKSEDLDVARMAVFLYNGELGIKPKILESNNYLEMDEKYSENKLERTYLSLLQLELFL